MDSECQPLDSMDVPKKEEVQVTLTKIEKVDPEFQEQLLDNVRKALARTNKRRPREKGLLGLRPI